MIVARRLALTMVLTGVRVLTLPVRCSAMLLRCRVRVWAVWGRGTV